MTIRSLFAGILFVLVFVSTGFAANDDAGSEALLNKRLASFDFLLDEEVYKMQRSSEQEWNDVVRADFLSEVFMEGDTPYVGVMAIVWKALPGHPVLRYLQYRSIWTHDFTNDVSAEEITRAAKAYVDFSKYLIHWEWGTPSEVLDLALTSFLGRFEHHFRHHEQLLGIDGLFDKFLLTFDYSPAKKLLAVGGSRWVLAAGYYKQPTMFFIEERSLGRYQLPQTIDNDKAVSALAEKASGVLREMVQEAGD